MRTDRLLLGLALCLVACGPEYPMPDVGEVDGIVPNGVTVTTSSQSLDARVAEVPMGFFVSSSGAWLGRLFSDSDFPPDAGDVVVLTHAFWTRLGATPSMVGSQIRIGPSSRTVIGVTPPGFAVPEGVDLWIPR